MSESVGKDPYVFSGARTEVISNKKVIVEGCEGIVDYSDDVVIVKSGRLKITVSGRDLKLKILTDSAAVIEGYLAAINFGYM